MEHALRKATSISPSPYQTATSHGPMAITWRGNAGFGRLCVGVGAAVGLLRQGTGGVAPPLWGLVLAGSAPPSAVLAGAFGPPLGTASPPCAVWLCLLGRPLLFPFSLLPLWLSFVLGLGFWPPGVSCAIRTGGGSSCACALVGLAERQSLAALS